MDEWLHQQCVVIIHQCPNFNGSFTTTYGARPWISPTARGYEDNVSNIDVNNNDNGNNKKNKKTYGNYNINKAHLRDLIAATGLIILLKLDPNRRYFIPCDFEIWWMTSQNYRAPLLYYIKLCASFQIHRWIQTEVTVRKRSIRVCPLWSWNSMDDLGKRQGSSSILHQALYIISKSWVDSDWSYRPETLNSGQNRWFFCPAWPWNLTDDLGK